MTSQGHPGAVFRRAIESGNVVLADATAREIGWLTLADALELTALFALKDPRRFRRAAGRWLRRYIAEHPDPGLDDVGLAVAHLGRLGGPEHAEALASLHGMARKATSREARTRVAWRRGPEGRDEAGVRIALRPFTTPYP